MGTIKTGDPENAQIAAAITAAKESEGLSFDQLATSSGIGYRSVKRYLADERVMQIKTVRALARAVGLDYLKLISDAEEMAE